MKNRGTAIVLCIFLGAIGIHRFYLGKTTTGFIYLVFCFTLIPAFFAFIDLIGLCFFETEESFDKRYNSAHMKNLKDPTKELEALMALLDRDLISKEDFNLKKNSLLKQIG